MIFKVEQQLDFKLYQNIYVETMDHIQKLGSKGTNELL
jgi:hypothetical protein